MIELREIDKWNVCQFWCTSLMGITFVLALGAELNDARAGWFSLPGIQRPKEEGASKPTRGFSVTIRKLMQEAKVQEEQGNLDRAIVLAERANKVSENSSEVIKPASDVSPAATKRYLAELQQKKADQIPKRKGEKSPLGQTRNADRAKSDSQSGAAKDSQTSRKKFAITKIDVTSDAPKPPKYPDEASIAAANEALKRLAVPNRPQQKPSTRTVDRTETPVRKAEAAALSPTVSDDPFDERLPGKPIVAEQPATPRSTLQQGASAKELFVDDDWATQVTPMPPMPSKEVKTSGDSTRMKLRSRFPVSVQTDLVQSAVAIQTTTLDDEGPMISPMNALPRPRVPTAPLALNTDSEPNRIQPTGAEEEVRVANVSTPSETPSLAPNAGDENRDGEILVPTPVETDARRIVEASQNWADSPSNLSSDADFPASSVLQLKRRLDSVAALQPGEINSKTPADHQSESWHDTPEESREIELQVVRLRRRHPFRELPSAEPASATSAQTKAVPVTINTARPPVIGRTSMIKWRPAKEESTFSTPGQANEIKSAQLPEDLRQALRENVSATPALVTPSAAPTIFANTGVKSRRTVESKAQVSTVSSVTSLSRRGSPTIPQLRGSLWDNATAPSIEGYSGSVAGTPLRVASSGKTVSELAESLSAPRPPSDLEVEQTSFDTPDELFKRRRRSNLATASMLPPPQESFSGDSQPPTAESLGSLQESAVSISGESTSPEMTATDNRTRSARAMLANGPVERLAFLLGISTSSASPLLGIAGLMMLVAGLWVVRVLVRGEKA